MIQAEAREIEVADLAAEIEIVVRIEPEEEQQFPLALPTQNTFNFSPQNYIFTLPDRLISHLYSYYCSHDFALISDSGVIVGFHLTFVIVVTPLDYSSDADKYSLLDYLFDYAIGRIYNENREIIPVDQRYSFVSVLSNLLFPPIVKVIEIWQEAENENRFLEISFGEVTSEFHQF